MTDRSYLVNQSRDPSNPWAPSPFGRLARTHALSVAGDAIFTTALAGLVFLNVSDLGQARWRVAAALLFTIVPFTVAAPFIGPIIDQARGGRKWMIVGLSFARTVICLLLVWDRDSQFLLYPQFLLALVFAKGYVIAKGALVPATVHSDEELVEANSKLSAISGVAAIAGGAPSLLVMWLASKFGSEHGPDLSLMLAAVVYVVAAAEAFRLPSVRVAEEPAGEAEVIELHTAGIRHGALAVSILRGQVGFLTFMLAFHFKDLDTTDPTASKLGLAGGVIGGQLGFMAGAAIAPRARRMISEERILLISVATTAMAGLLTAAMGELAGATLLAFSIGLTSNTAKQAFDTIVQRDAPDANRGRAFARFETRFQLVWVLGALVPIAVTINLRVGFVLMAVASVISAVLYFVGLRNAVAQSRRRPAPFSGEPELVEPRPLSRSFLKARRARGFAPLPEAEELADTQVALPAAPADPMPTAIPVDAIDTTSVLGPADDAPAPDGKPAPVPDPAVHTATIDPLRWGITYPDPPWRMSEPPLPGFAPPGNGNGDGDGDGDGDGTDDAPGGDTEPR